MQTIQIDHAHALVEVKFSGFYDPERAHSAGENVRDAIRSLGSRVGQHLSLYDLSDVDIAPPATMTLLQQTFASAEVRAIWARRVAFFTPSALARLQIKRLRTVREDIGIFEDRASAVAWLTQTAP